MVCFRFIIVNTLHKGDKNITIIKIIINICCYVYIFRLRNFLISCNYTFSLIEVYTEIYRQKHIWILSTELEFNFYSPKC